MYLTDLKKDFFDQVVTSRVLLLVNSDVDGVCATKILQYLFKCDHVLYTMVAVRGKKDLFEAFRDNMEGVSRHLPSPLTRRLTSPHPSPGGSPPLTLTPHQEAPLPSPSPPTRRLTSPHPSPLTRRLTSPHPHPSPGGSPPLTLTPHQEAHLPSHLTSTFNSPHQVKHVVLVNCGATIDLCDFLDPAEEVLPWCRGCTIHQLPCQRCIISPFRQFIRDPPHQVIFYVLDNHRPVDVTNIYNDGQVGAAPAPAPAPAPGAVVYEAGR